MTEMKIAAYCRVSTDKYDQINSLENQRQYFSDYIKRYPGWTLTEIYVDEGVTGTTTKKRKAFNKMINDAEEGKFDLIITKEISRFARNTLDSILYTRKLKEKNIGVFFLNDNINTLDADGELRLTILSSIAQEESRKTSERVKWGQKRSMEQGVVFGRSLLGYDVKKGKISINPQGAETVKLIFHKFAEEKKGAHTIAKELEADGIKTIRGAGCWSNSAILRIIKNEKYCGDLLQKKTYTPNYLTHEKKRNKGAEDYILIKNHHSPIISRELFEKAQEELKNRGNPGKEGEKYSRRYAFSGKIKCSACGCSYVSRSSRKADGTVYRYWRCANSLKYGKESHFNCKAISDSLLKEMTADAFKHISCHRSNMTGEILEIVESQCSFKKQYYNKEELNKLELKKREIYQMYIAEEISKDDFIAMNLLTENKIKKFESESLEENSQKAGINNKMVQTFIEDIFSAKAFNEDFFRTIIDRITIDKDFVYISFLYLSPDIKYRLTRKK